MKLNGINLEITIEAKEGQETSETMIVGESVFQSLILDFPVGTEGTPTIGISIPTCELKIEISNISSVFFFMNKTTEKKIIISLNGTMYKYSVNNLDNEINKENKCDVTFFGTLFLENFIGEYKQRSFGEEMTAYTLLKKYKEDNKDNKEIELDISLLNDSDDKMKWIQPNVPDYVFISNIIKHIWYSSDGKDDFVIGAITEGSAGKGKIILLPFVKSLEEALNTSGGKYTKLKGAITHSLTPTQRKSVREKLPNGIPLLSSVGIKIETCAGKWQYLLSDEAYQPIVKITDTQNLMPNVESEDTSLFQKLVKSILTPKAPKGISDSVKGQVLPARIDTGSTHENYWAAYIRNQKMYLQILNTLIYVTVDTDESSLKLLDFVYFESGVGGGFGSVCIILRISKYIDKQGQKTQILLAKLQ